MGGGSKQQVPAQTIGVVPPRKVPQVQDADGYADARKRELLARSGRLSTMLLGKAGAVAPKPLSVASRLGY